MSTRTIERTINVGHRRGSANARGVVWDIDALYADMSAWLSDEIDKGGELTMCKCGTKNWKDPIRYGNPQKGPWICVIQYSYRCGNCGRCVVIGGTVQRS